MKDFSNLHVMSLKGVCLDGGPVPFIILPYMANGSLAAYLKKERRNLVMMKDCSTSDVTIDSEDSAQVSSLIYISMSCRLTKSEDHKHGICLVVYFTRCYSRGRG